MILSKNNVFRFTIFSFVFLIGVLIWMPANSQAASLKIKMNGKTSLYRKTQTTVKYGKKKISNTKYKGLTIKGTRMAAYDDVFRKGLKVKTKYKSSSQTIVMSKNGMEVSMTIGSKYAYVNGEKQTLPAAPVKVRYVNKKKTKILVPVKFLCDQFGYNYKVSGSTITITDAMLVEYDDTIVKSSVIGNLSYNNKQNKLSTMPIIKLDGTIYMPALESFQNIVGIECQYDEEAEVLTLKNEATNTTVKLTLNQDTFTVNDIEESLDAPMYMVTRKDTGKGVLCIPAKTVCKKLGYSYKWDSAKSLVLIHDLIYFNWKAESIPDPADVTTNYITEASATYNQAMDSISFSFRGSDPAIMNQASVVRNDQVITITIPATSKYALDKFSFTKFVSILDRFEVVEDGSGNVVFHITGFNPNDFAYSAVDGMLTINIMTQYIGDYALKIMKPSELTINEVTNEDFYQNKKFNIYISGDHVDYLNANPIIINSDAINDVSVWLGTDGNTVITVTTSELQGYKIYEKSDSFVVAVDKPRNIYENIIVLDAGHGGYDAGASNRGTKEKNLNFDILYTRMKDYFSSNAPDTKVYWTRTSDVFITLANRAAFAKKVGADMFVSLHMNSAKSSSANGTEVYYSTNNNSSSFSGITSKIIATTFKNNLVSRLGTKSRGVKTAGYYVTKHNTVPAVLIELGFLSGSSDYSKLTNSTFQQNSAKVIYDTIIELFTNYPTGR